MGCDIHSCLEIQNQDGTWEPIGIELRKDEDDKEPQVTNWNDKPYSDPEWGHIESRIYSDRNYDLFAILANVRNGYWFAGCPTGEGFQPISPPRGVPDDASLLYRLWTKEWGRDGHSHSYHTLQQLIDYDWKQSTRKQGLVDSKHFQIWEQDRKEPAEYCGGVSGPGIQIVTQPEMKALIQRGQANLAYTAVDWMAAYNEQSDEFLTVTIPFMQQLVSERGLRNDQIRYVFFFDN